MNTQTFLLPPHHLLMVNLPVGTPLLEQLNEFLGAHFSSPAKDAEKTVGESPWQLWVKPPIPSSSLRLQQGKQVFRAEDGENTPLLHVATLSDHVFMITDAQHHSTVEWDLGRKTITVFQDSQCPNLVETVYTTVRTLGYFLLNLEGVALVHASAVMYRGKAIVLVGEKGSGKTTLGSVLLEKGCRFLASDRCLLWLLKNRAMVSGWMCTYRLKPLSFSKLFSETTAQRLENFARSKRGENGWFFAGKFRCPPNLFLQAGKWEPGYEGVLGLVVELQPNHADAELKPHQHSAQQLLTQHQVSRKLPPQLAIHSSPLQPLPDFSVPAAVFQGRRSPEEMATEILKTLEALP